MQTQQLINATTTTTKPSTARGPKGLPVVGNMLQFRRDPLTFLPLCASYGDVARFTLGKYLFHLLSHPADIERVLVTDHHNFVKPTGFRRGSGTISERLFGQGLLTTEGESWLRQRRLAQPAFHRMRIAGYADTMVNHTLRMLETWRDGETRDARTDMMQVTLGIACATLFSADISDEADSIGTALNVVMREYSCRFGNVFQLPLHVPTPSNRRFIHAVERLDQTIYHIIADRRTSGVQTHDLLSMLMEARDEDGDGGGMSDKQLRDEVMTLFLAGHETTALALSWTWYLLSHHPEVEAKLADELRTALGGGAPTVADLPQLPYTEKIIKESMRVYPPAWLISSRMALKDCEIGGYPLPAGSFVSMSPWVVHHDARWCDAPLQFNPDRWTDEFTRRLPKFAYFPFGGGPHLCIGNSFALMEAVLLLATIAQRFRLELVPGQTIVPQPSITLRPKYGVKVTVTKVTK